MTYKPFKVAETDTGQFRVLFLNKPVGFGMLAFDQEVQAEILCGSLNQAYAEGYTTGHANGYDAGVDAMSRARYQTGGA